MANKPDEWKVEYHKKLSDSTMGKNKGKIPWNKGLTAEIDPRVKAMSEKLKQYMLKYAEEVRKTDPNFYNKWRANLNDILRANNTFNTSRPEEEYYQKLVNKYGVDDVVRWYSDERYPFACDFYIIVDVFNSCHY